MDPLAPTLCFQDPSLSFPPGGSPFQDHPSQGFGSSPLLTLYTITTVFIGHVLLLRGTLLSNICKILCNLTTFQSPQVFLLSPFDRWGHRGSETLSNSFRSLCQISGKTEGHCMNLFYFGNSGLFLSR